MDSGPAAGRCRSERGAGMPEETGYWSTAPGALLCWTEERSRGMKPSHPCPGASSVGDKGCAYAMSIRSGLAVIVAAPQAGEAALAVDERRTGRACAG